MTHQADHNVVETVGPLLCENGLSYRAAARRLLWNEATRIERSPALAAAPDPCTETRQGYADGFQPKTVPTRLAHSSHKWTGKPWREQAASRKAERSAAARPELLF